MCNYVSKDVTKRKSLFKGVWDSKGRGCGSKYWCGRGEWVMRIKGWWYLETLGMFCHFFVRHTMHYGRYGCSAEFVRTKLTAWRSVSSSLSPLHMCALIACLLVCLLVCPCIYYLSFFVKMPWLFPFCEENICIGGNMSWSGNI